MKEGKLITSSIELAIELTLLYDRIEKKAYLKNQLARAGTSVGANIHEAKYAHSRADFIAKMQIALKECHETEFWLTVLSQALPEYSLDATRLREKAGSIRRMLISTLNTAKSNSEKE
ncbi:MAG: four helix bundle protein [Akkermansia sp.]|nr:four helix bundle protein [Akkermansia sp.]